MYCERSEATNKDLCDIEKKFDIEIVMEKVAEAQRMADLAMAALSRSRDATSFDGAEACGTEDRNEHERQNLETAVKILELVQNEDESAFELVSVASKEGQEGKGSRQIERKDKEGRKKVPPSYSQRVAAVVINWRWREGATSVRWPVLFREVPSCGREISLCLLFFVA